MTTRQDIRWKQRFENFERAFVHLRSAFEEKKLPEFSQLEKEGIIQRFEFTYELAWKTLKDYLEHSGFALEQITPKFVIKTAFAARIIEDGQGWIDMIEHRNMMSHMYSEKLFNNILQEIQQKYLTAFDQLFLLLKEKSIAE